MPTEHDYVDVRDLFASINPSGLDEKDLARDGASFVEPHTINDYHLFRAGHQAALEAQQGQGEPVAWMDPRSPGMHATISNEVKQHNVKFGGAPASAVNGYTIPLYTHADPADSRHKLAMDAACGELEIMRAQLAGAQALLREIADHCNGCVMPTEQLLRDWGSSIDAHLSASAEPSTAKQETRDAMRIRHKREFDALDGSGFRYQECRCGAQGSYPVEVKHCVCGKAFASAEPSAPTPMPAYMEAACDKFDWTPEEALRFYAEGKHFDTDNGRTRILCTGAIASHALKGMSKEYADLKGSEQGEPSAPAEIDERAEAQQLIEALRTCEKWFIKHSPTAPLIGGFGDAEHPMLTCIRAALGRKS